MFEQIILRSNEENCEEMIVTDLNCKLLLMKHNYGNKLILIAGAAISTNFGAGLIVNHFVPLPESH